MNSRNGQVLFELDTEQAQYTRPMVALLQFETYEFVVTVAAAVGTVVGVFSPPPRH